MKKSFKRVLSIALAFVMLALMIPTGVFSATAAAAQEQVNIYIGGTGVPSGETGEWYETFYDAVQDYDISSAANKDLYVYNFYVVDDVTETQDWGINIRANVNIYAYDPANAPTVTLDVADQAAVSAWFYLTNYTTATISHVNFEIAETNARKVSLFALSTGAAITLDTVNTVVPTGYEAGNGGNIVQVRTEGNNGITITGKCSFKEADGTGDTNWVGKWQNIKSGPTSEYIVNIVDATLDMADSHFIQNTSAETINVTVKNSTITTTTGHIFNQQTGNGTINVTAKNSTFKTTGTGKVFYAGNTANVGGHVTVDLDGCTVTGTAAGQLFHVEGNGADANTYKSVTGTVKNSTINYSTGTGYVVRSTGSTNYDKIDLVFDNTDITANQHVVAFGGATGFVGKVEFINGSTVANNGAGRLVHASGAGSDITLVLSKDSTVNVGTKNVLYHSQTTGKVTLIYDNWDMVDSNAPFTHSTTADGSKFYYNCALDFTFGYRNSTGSLTVTDSIFNALNTALNKPTTFGMYLENCTITTNKRLLLSSGTHQAKTFNVDIIGSTITTSHGNLFANRNDDYGKTWNINIVDSTITNTASGTSNAIFLLQTNVYNTDGSEKTNNYPVKAFNLTVSGNSVLDANYGYIINATNSGDSATNHSDMNIVINGGTLKNKAYVSTKTDTETGAVTETVTRSALISNAVDANDVTTITVNGGTLETAGKAIYSTNNTQLTINDGKFGGEDIDGECLIDVRQPESTTNIYGGEFARAGITGGLLINAFASNMNIYGGTFYSAATGSTNMLLRHNYPTTVTDNGDGTFTVAPTNDGEQNTALKIYGGTFMTKQGAVVSAGTSTGNGHYGNVYVYGGVFVKYGTQTVNGEGTFTGMGILDSTNNQTYDSTSTSNRKSNNNYNILGGVWVSPANDLRAYKYTSSDDANYPTDKVYSNGKGALNKQAANITTKDAGLTAANYANAGITDDVWAVIAEGYVAEAVVSNTAQNVAAGDMHFGNMYLQIKSGTTTGDTSTDLRVLFEIDRTVANNVEFAEIGYYIAIESDTAANIVAAGDPIVDEAGVIYDAVNQSNGTKWSPADESKSIAILNVNNLPSAYFLDGSVFYVVAYVKTTSGNIYYSDVYTVDATTTCAADIKTVESAS